MEYKMGSCIGISRNQVNGGCLRHSVSARVTGGEGVQDEQGVDVLCAPAECLLGSRPRVGRCTLVLEEGRRQEGKGAVVSREGDESSRSCFGGGTWRMDATQVL